MTAKWSGNIKYLALSLLAVLSFFSPIFSQTHISGTINKYGRVTGISTDYVVVGNPAEFAQFHAGDTVLLIQMKGVRIYAKEDVSYGSSGFSYGKAGMHEFLTVLSVEAGNIIRFRNNIVNTLFDLTGDLQIVKVPSYNFAQVDPAGLTSAVWDSTSKTGGVLAAIFGRTLTLKGNIDVTGKGFKGGAIAAGKGICVIDNTIKWNKYAYSGLSDSAGFKGEGLAIIADPSASNTPPFYPIYPLFAKGYGRNFNGGGGGNGKFSGGGGGSNYGKGGLGGREISTCSPQSNGGLGGIQITGTGLDGGLFLGGGGGGSTNQGGTPTAGGNGGGIVILICDTLKGNGYKILADGATSSVTASGNAGAGGGGGGGSIALYLQSYSTVPATSAMTISANGAKGGNNAGTFGEGGGGGGGLVNTSNITSPANVIKSVAGGLPGTRSGPSTAVVGDPGKNVTTFVPILNGFLFNSIVSSANGSAIDSICSNVTPKKISGTQPVGGSGTYIYTWLKSSSATGPWTPIAGATAKDYTASAPEASTFWIRRYVLDNVTSLKDTSKAVKIVVQPAITGNNIGKDTTICMNQNPLPLLHNGIPAGGYGNPHYHWLQNTDNIWTSYINAAGPDSTKQDFDPSNLNLTTYYKRKVTAGHCVDYSATVTITVLPSITGNVTTRPDSVICEGSLFNSLGASAAGGGSGAYIYQWQDSTTAGSWLAAAGANSNTNYTADTSQFAVTEKRYFRRTVYSGPYNTCRSNSVPILLTRYHKIKNNLIAADNVICSGSIPAELTGSDPVQGDLTYAYQWQDSSKVTSWTTRGTAKSPFLPPALTDTTWYRRIVTSSKCTNTSNKIVIRVHKPIINNITSLISGPGPDTTICNGGVPNRINGSIPAGGTGTPGDYAFLWQFSTDNSTYTDIASATLASYKPAALTVTTWFRRRVISGMCTSFSNTVRVIVLPAITNNVISVTKPGVCYNTVPDPVSGTALTGGAGGTPTWIWEQSINGTTWTGAAGTANQQNYSPPALTVKTWYRRVILSGPSNCCIDTSNVITLDINPLPTGSFTSLTDTTICNGNQVLLKVHLTGASPWKVTYNENTTGVVVNGIGSADYVISRVPAATTSMSVFNYSLSAVEDQNGCLATLMTGTRKANVYRVPVANAGPDDAVCGPAYTLKAVPSDGTGLWQFPPEVLSSVANDPHSLIKIDSSFTGANVTYTFYWEEINGICKNKDDVIIRFDKRIGAVSAGTGGAIMSFDNITKVDATPLQPFETGLWSVTAGSGDFEDEASNSTFVRNISLGINTFKWTVTNGNCKAESLVSYEVSIPVIPEGITPDGNLINDSLKIEGLRLTAQEIDLTILNGAGSVVFTTSNRNGNKWQVWDGKSAKGTDLPEGTYYYLLKVYTIDTQHVSQVSGFIILKRN